MKIKVRREHIQRGVRLHACVCPVALAMHDAGLIDPHAGPFTLSWLSCGDRVRVPAPDGVRDFISRYDGQKPVEPFKFKLEAAS